MYMLSQIDILGNLVHSGCSKALPAKWGCQHKDPHWDFGNLCIGGEREALELYFPRAWPAAVGMAESSPPLWIFCLYI